MMIDNFPKNGNFFERKKVFVEFRMNVFTQLSTVLIINFPSIGQERKILQTKKGESKESKRENMSIFRKFMT